MNAAARAAAAALDPHDIFIEALAVGALEAKPHRAREGGCAAAAIHAGATGARAVQLCCGASSEADSDRFLGTDSSLTLLSLLVRYRKLQLALPDLAQSGFPDQATV